MTRVEVKFGLRNIGGNFIKITDRDRTIVFDQGIRFGNLSKYFDKSVQPSGVMELRKLEVIPKEEWYENIDKIYISHLHLDHLGALSNIPPNIDIHLPGKSVYLNMKQKWENSPTWLNIIPESYYSKVSAVNVLTEDKNRVLAIPVSHSAFPSVAYLYFGYDKTILYTGDIRVNSFLNDDQFEMVNRGISLLKYLPMHSDMKIDLLILEGTNFGSERAPIDPLSSLLLIEKIMKNSDISLVTCHYLDLEFIIALCVIAKKLNFLIYLTSEIMAKMIKESNIDLSISILEEFSDTPIFRLDSLEHAVESNALIILSYFEIFDLIRKFESHDKHKKRIVSILTEPEPGKEEIFEYSVMSRWLSLYGIHSYRIRVSGHYYPFEIGEILRLNKFKKILPIHTEHPDILLQYSAFSYRP